MNLVQKIRHNAPSCVLIAVLISVWEVICAMQIVPKFMLPSPTDICRAFVQDFPVLMGNALITFSEAAVGLVLGVVVAFLLAILMDKSPLFYRACYPLLVISQTIPTVAIAPLLVLWLGYGIPPKIILVVVCCLFPITVSLLEGLRSPDDDYINLMRTMGASNRQIFRHVKLPCAVIHLFAGLKIAVTYSFIGAVVAEWLGGTAGLGVYMTRVRKTYNFDKMFAVILLISVVSLLLMQVVVFLERRCVGFKRPDNSIVEPKKPM